MDISHFINEGVISILVAVGGGLVTLIRSFAFVKEGEQGVKLRFGKVVRDRKGKPIVVQPGFVWMIPFYHTLVRRHVRQQTIRCENQVVMTYDNLVFYVSAMILFRVNDVYHALFELDDLNSSMDDFCMALLRDELSGLTLEEITNTEEVSSNLLAKAQAKGVEWGVEFILFKLTNCSPTDETLALILLPKLTETRMRALTTAATSLGIEPSEMPASLAAALIGTPLVVGIGDTGGLESTSRVAARKVNPRFQLTVGENDHE